MDITGNAALVTGANRGLGRQRTAELRERGTASTPRVLPPMVTALRTRYRSRQPNCSPRSLRRTAFLPCAR